MLAHSESDDIQAAVPLVLAEQPGLAVEAAMLREDVRCQTSELWHLGSVVAWRTVRLEAFRPVDQIQRIQLCVLDHGHLRSWLAS